MVARPKKNPSCVVCGKESLKKSYLCGDCFIGNFKSVVEGSENKKSFVYPDFQEMIKQRRLDREMTLKYLAPKVGTTYVTLGNWERGYHMPKLDNIFDLARMLSFEVKFFDKETGEEITFNHGINTN